MNLAALATTRAPGLVLTAGRLPQSQAWSASVDGQKTSATLLVPTSANGLTRLPSFASTGGFAPTSPKMSAKGPVKSAGGTEATAKDNHQATSATVATAQPPSPRPLRPPPL